MNWVERRAGRLLALGLLAVTAWTAVVTFAMPSWFNSGEDCAFALGGSDSGGGTVEINWLPPRATCDFGGGDVRDFISPAKSTALTIAFVLIAVVVLTSLFFTVRRLFETGGVIRSAEAVDLRSRRTAHLASGAVLTTLTIGAYCFANAVAIIFGGSFPSVVVSASAVIALAALGAGLDRQVGPLPSTAVKSRRRGTTAGLITFATVFVATAVTGKMPFPELWTAPLGAVAYVIVVLSQWTSNRTDAAADDGDTVQEDLLGRP